MFAWIKRKALEKSAANIAEILNELTQAATLADKRIVATGLPNPSDIALIKKLQRQFYFELNGPIPLNEVKSTFIDPILASDLIDGAKLAVTHVFDSYSADSKRADR